LLNRGDGSPDAAPRYQQVKSKETGIESPHDKIIRVIQEAGERSDNLPEFLKAVNQEGVEVKHSFRGKNISLSYSVDDYAVKGSSVHGQQSKLASEYGIIYKSERDRTHIENGTVPTQKVDTINSGKSNKSQGFVIAPNAKASTFSATDHLEFDEYQENALEGEFRMDAKTVDRERKKRETKERIALNNFKKLQKVLDAIQRETQKAFTWAVEGVGSVWGAYEAHREQKRREEALRVSRAEAKAKRKAAIIAKREAGWAAADKARMEKTLNNIKLQAEAREAEAELKRSRRRTPSKVKDLDVDETPTLKPN
jgi:hypothetical protein